jgi:4-amino-4-deoxy-L-arabinose transferase-like glycosyltransferase
VFWLDRVPSAEIDLVQTAWVTGSLLCLLHAVESNKPYIYWLAALACVGGGLFTKWTGPAFFYLTAVVWLRYRHRLHLLASLPHLLAVTLLGLVFGLWLWNAHRLAGGELFATLEREAMMRLSPTRHPRPYPWSELLTFPLSFFLGCAPAALLLILAFWYGKRGVRRPIWRANLSVTPNDTSRRTASGPGVPGVGVAVDESRFSDRRPRPSPATYPAGGNQRSPFYACRVGSVAQRLLEHQ